MGKALQLPKSNHVFPVFRLLKILFHCGGVSRVRNAFGGFRGKLSRALHDGDLLGMVCAIVRHPPGTILVSNQLSRMGQKVLGVVRRLRLAQVLLTRMPYWPYT
jgi:hypothetical protein